MTKRKPKAFSACQQCGNPIPAERPANAMYCSRKCGAAAGTARAPSRAKQPTARACEACGESFIAARVDARACSARCRLTLRRMTHGYTPERNCLRCDKPIDKGKPAGTKYCSASCRSTSVSLRWYQTDKGRAYRRTVQNSEEYLSYRRSNYADNADRERARVKAHISRVNQLAREKAGRHGYEWTGPELEMVGRRDLTSVELAEKLGRTVLAVQNMRAKINREDPRTLLLLGVPRLRHDRSA